MVLVCRKPVFSLREIKLFGLGLGLGPPQNVSGSVAESTYALKILLQNIISPLEDRICSLTYTDDREVKLINPT